MFRLRYTLILMCAVIISITAKGQTEPLTTHKADRYAKEMTGKIDAYHKRLSLKTEKTLERLSRWERKVQKVLHKTSPATEQKLFGNGQLTFNLLLEQFKMGEMEMKNFRGNYDRYLDSVSTIAAYLNTQTHAQEVSVKNLKNRADELSETIGQTEYLQAFISKRKKQLCQEGMQYAAGSRALKKINKESYYYVETLKNYKELFSDTKKQEEVVRKTLNQIPAFQKFMRENSMLASLFAIPQGGGAGSTAPSLAGLQTRVGVQDIIQQRIAAGGPNGAAQVQQNLMAAQSKLSDIKDKLLKGGHIGADGDVEMPDFKPNGQRTRTFSQRLEYGFDMQFSKSNSLIPSASDMGISIGYRITDRSVAGVGFSFKLGLGSIENIRLSGEGAGLRSYIDWKIKGAWYASGGYEMNYLKAFKTIAELKDKPWQRSGLVGISRQYKAGKKLKGEVKVMWDYLHNQHIPHSSAFVWRFGYSF